MPIKRKTAAKKTAKKPTGLKKYQAAMKKATKVIDARLKKKEGEIKKLKAEKAKKVAMARKKYAK